MRPEAGWYPLLAAQALDGLRAHTQPALAEFLAEVGNLAELDVTFIQVAAALEPEPLTPEVLIRRLPYACPEALIENLLACAGRGWLTQTGGKFGLTEAGHRLAEQLTDLSDNMLSRVEVLPSPEMQNLFGLLHRVRDTVKRLPEPAQKPAFELGLRFDRPCSAPLLAQIRRRLLDLFAFRDDAHVAAWLPLEPEGQIWETFTLIWRQQARNAAELADQLSHRYYAELDYAAILEKLVARGWIFRWGGNYQVQTRAAGMRQQVEDETERLFAAAFTGLNTTELAQLQALLAKFCQALQQPEKSAG